MWGGWHLNFEVCGCQRAMCLRKISVGGKRGEVGMAYFAHLPRGLAGNETSWAPDSV